MWGIVPAAGSASRIQPLGFSKELLPLGVTLDGETQSLQPAISYIVERLIMGGATRICFVVSPDKADIMKYFASKIGSVDVCYVVQPEPVGLCDAVFRAAAFVGEDEVAMIGLPDTIWFPENGFLSLSDNMPSLLLFPVTQPELFDVVITDNQEFVTEIQVKKSQPDSSWVWGAIKLPGDVLHSLFRLWVKRGRVDQYIGTLINAYLASGGAVKAVHGGEVYKDVGTAAGYRDAVQMLERRAQSTRESIEPLRGRVLRTA